MALFCHTGMKFNSLQKDEGNYLFVGNKVGVDHLSLQSYSAGSVFTTLEGVPRCWVLINTCPGSLKPVP